MVIFNCKEILLAEFYGLRQNFSWIRSTLSCEVLGLSAPVLCGTLPLLETTLTNVGQQNLKVDLFHTRSCNYVAF